MKNVNILVETKRAVVAEFKKAAAKFTKSKSSADRLVRAIIAGRKVSIPKGFNPSCGVLWT